LARPDKIEEWLPEAIDLMVRKGIGLEEAVADLNLGIPTAEIKTIERRKSFDRLRFQAQQRYFNELATDPNFKKDSVIGRMLRQADMLEREGLYDKAAEVLFKAAKAAGFVGPEQTVSIFGELSQADLDAIRSRLETKPARVN
jgi:hypothetical protein